TGSQTVTRCSGAHAPAVTARVAFHHARPDPCRLRRWHRGGVDVQLVQRAVGPSPPTRAAGRPGTARGRPPARRTWARSAPCPGTSRPGWCLTVTRPWRSARCRTRAATVTDNHYEKRTCCLRTYTKV